MIPEDEVVVKRADLRDALYCIYKLSGWSGNDLADLPWIDAIDSLELALA